jgi:hypothetical protein
MSDSHSHGVARSVAYDRVPHDPARYNWQDESFSVIMLYHPLDVIQVKYLTQEVHFTREGTYNKYY